MAARDRDIFAGVGQSTVITTAGDCQVPILYRDGSMLVVGYRIDRHRAATALSHVALEPLVMAGKALALLCIFEYRDTTIGPYNEIGLGVFARRKARPLPIRRILRDVRSVDEVGMYVTNLPVNTPAAYAAGVELWGYPKYVTGIDTRFDGTSTTATLESEFELRHRVGRGITIKGLPFITFTCKHERLIRTVVEVGHMVRFGGARSLRIQLTGDGPTSTTMKAFGLDSLRPTFVQRADGLRAVLPIGKDCGDALA